METQKKWMTVTGWVLTLLPLAAFLPSAAFKFMDGPKFMEGWTASGYSAASLLPIALAETACIILYLIPKTSVFGAILTVGYLGGAVATHVRLGQMAAITPIVLGVMIWGGLFLREPRLRALLPLKS
jgi:DoxX-like family